MDLVRWGGRCPSPECRKRLTGSEVLREMLEYKKKLFERAFDEMLDDDP